MRESVTAYVALGANLGMAAQAVGSALVSIGELPGTRVVRHSSLYRTAPLGAEGPDFINAVVQVETVLTAPDLLTQLQRIEAEAGRERPYPNAPRTLDLDILLYGNARIDSARLRLPHPRMKERAFVLVPLAEISPQLVTRDELKAVDAQAITRVAG